jgi:DNA-binding NarL/FixJ family response regulator
LENTVVIVDDKAIMRQALSRLFKAAGGFCVCGEASNGIEAIELARKLKPDLIVLDLCMPEMNGLETARELKNLKLSARTILYSMHAEGIVAKDAIAAGVNAIVSKSDGVSTLISKARAVLNTSAA